MLYMSPGEVEVHSQSAEARGRLKSMLVFRTVFFPPDTGNATGEDSKPVVECVDGPVYMPNGVEGGTCVIAAEDSSPCTSHNE